MNEVERLGTRKGIYTQTPEEISKSANLDMCIYVIVLHRSSKSLGYSKERKKCGI